MTAFSDAGTPGAGSTTGDQTPPPNPNPDVPPTPPGYGYDFQPQRLYRSMTDRVWAGVCGGLAQHFGWDVGATRALYAILTIFTGIFPMLILYIVMAIVIPNEPLGDYAANAAPPAPGTTPAYGPGTPRPQYVRRSASPGTGAIVLGILLILGGAIALLDRYVRIDWDLMGPAVAIGLGLVVIVISVMRRPT